MNVSLLHGYVTVPENTVVLNETKTPQSDYAAIICDYNNALPPYLIFSETPFRGISEDVQDMLIDWASALVPEIARLRDEEDDAFRLLAERHAPAEEWVGKRRVCMYFLPENRGKKDRYDGACVKRKEMKTC